MFHFGATGIMGELENIEVGSAPWMVGGDFNDILNKEEKLGGLEFTQMEAVDFAQCINNCGLNEVHFSGSKFTWRNGRINEACISRGLMEYWLILHSCRYFHQQKFNILLDRDQIIHQFMCTVTQKRRFL